jgi:VanZ family protein
MPQRRASLATPLALVYALLVLYASLYPFAGWRWPPGQNVSTLVLLPWPPWRDDFDQWANLWGYLPLGLLATVAARRSGLGWLATALAGLAAPIALSYACEVLQQFVPTRHPSLKDLAMNAAGCALGATLALLFQTSGLADRWHALRQRWFARDHPAALALLALWPLALLFPAPVPLGLGQVEDVLRTTLADWIEGVPWAEVAYRALQVPPARDVALSALAEGTITALGLLAPCLLAFAVVAPWWRRLVLALGAALLATGALSLATLLNFGPEHASAWIGRATLPAFGAALVVAALLSPMPRALIVGAGLIVLSALVVTVSHAPVDPYFAQSLQSWEQGRFVRFHGLSQWLGWCWPYAAMAWFLAQLVAGPDHAAAYNRRR